VALCLGTYVGPRGVGVSYERGTPVLYIQVHRRPLRIQVSGANGLCASDTSCARPHIRMQHAAFRAKSDSWYGRQILAPRNGTKSISCMAPCECARPSEIQRLLLSKSGILPFNEKKVHTHNLTCICNSYCWPEVMDSPKT
jgi:hypothetical protein